KDNSINKSYGLFSVKSEIIIGIPEGIYPERPARQPLNSEISTRCNTGEIYRFFPYHHTVRLISIVQQYRCAGIGQAGSSIYHFTTQHQRVEITPCTKRIMIACKRIIFMNILYGITKGYTI